MLLEPNAAQAFAVALHELATNAAKYGSLSGRGGQVDLKWVVDPIRRQVLANSVEQLEEALRWAARSTIEKATFHFLTGLRRRGSLSA